MKNAAWVGVGAWLLICASIPLMPGYRFALPGPIQKALVGTGGEWALVLMLLGFIVLHVSCRWLPNPSSISDSLDRRTTWSLLALIMALGAWMGLGHIGEPPAMYGGDSALDILAPLNALEFSDWRLTYSDDREPLYTYLAVPFLAVFRDLPLLPVQRLVSASSGLLTIWLLYLLGREVGDRRTGLLAAALGAVSKPLVMKTLGGLRVITLAPAVCLAFLFFFRAVRKPTRAHFLQFALALALGAYSYTPFRAFVPFLGLAFLLFLLHRSGGWSVSRNEKAILCITASMLILVSLGSSGYLGTSAWVHHLLSPWMSAPLLIIVGSLAIWNARLPGSKGKGSLLWDGSAAVLLSLFLMAPILSRLTILQHVGAHILGQMPEGGPSTSGSAAQLLGGFSRIIQSLFIEVPDRSDYAIPGDAALDIPTLALLALGAAHFLALPSGKAVFLLLGVLAGVAPSLLSRYPDSGKLFGAVPLLLVLAAWGARRFWESARAALPGKRAVVLPGLLVALLILGSAAANHRRVYDDWALNPAMRYPSVHMAVQAEKDWKTGRVFTAAPRVADIVTQQVLLDGRGVMRLQGSNPMVLRPGESPRDVVVLCGEKETGNAGRLMEGFPGGSWTDVHRDQRQHPNSLPLVGRFQIPGKLIPEVPFDRMSSSDMSSGDKQGISFEWKRVPDDGWVRTFYENGWEGCGLARGLIRREDWVPTLDTPSTSGDFPPLSVRFNGHLAVESKGRVEFRSGRSGCILVLEVDGKRVLDVRPRRGEKEGRGSIILAPGVHKLDVIVYDRAGKGFPAVTFRADGSEQEQRL